MYLKVCTQAFGIRAERPIQIHISRILLLKPVFLFVPLKVRASTRWNYFTYVSNPKRIFLIVSCLNFEDLGKPWQKPHEIAPTRKVISSKYSRTCKNWKLGPVRRRENLEKSAQTRLPWLATKSTFPRALMLPPDRTFAQRDFAYFTS